MNRRKIFTIAAVAAGLAVLPLAAQRVAARHGEGRAAMHERFFSHVTSALNLTEAQKATAKQLFEQTHAQAKPLKEQMKQNRTEMEAAVKANNSGQIAAAAARQGQIAGQLAEIHARAMAGFYAQLTPEQKAKADEMKDRLHARVAKRFGSAGARGEHGSVQ